MSVYDTEESQEQVLERIRKAKENKYNEDLKKLSKYYIKPFQCKILQFIEEFDLKNKYGNIVGSGIFHVGHTKKSNIFTIHIHIEGYIKEHVYSVRSIFSLVNPEYGTIKEYRQSTIGRGSNAQIRNLCLIRYPDYFHCRITTGTRSKPIIKRIEIDLNHEKLIIGEGAILLLYRQLALNNFSGELHTYAYDSNGNVVPSILKSGASKPFIINGLEIDTIIIERYITKDVDHQESTDEVLTVMSRNAGFCILHEWIHRDLSLHVKCGWNPYTGKTKHGCSESAYILHDMELRSKSRDLNVLLKAEHRQYIDENPDIVNLIGDFLQATILEQPDNVIEFAQNYFNAFVPIIKNNSEDEEEIDVKQNYSWGASVKLVREPYCPYDQCIIL